MKHKRLFDLIRIMVLVGMAVFMTGCEAKQEFDFQIEHHNWQFSNMVDNQQGSLVGCSEEMSETYPDAAVMNITCKAESGAVNIYDADTGNSAEFRYSEYGKDTNSITYKLIPADGAETAEGMAVSSITEYAKGLYEYTLVVDIDRYTLYFYEKIEK